MNYYIRYICHQSILQNPKVFWKPCKEGEKMGLCYVAHYKPNNRLLHLVSFPPPPLSEEERMLKEWWGLISAPLIPAGIQSFWQNPADSSGIKFGRKACYFFHSSAFYSGGIWAFWNWDWNVLRNSQEWNAMESSCLFVSHLWPNKPPTKHCVTWFPFVNHHHHTNDAPNDDQRPPCHHVNTNRPPSKTTAQKPGQLPRNDNKPPKTNMNNGQHTKMATTPKKRTTAHHHQPPQPTNDGQCPWTDTGDADWRWGTRTMMRDKGQQRWWLLSLLLFYIWYCKHPWPLSSPSTNAMPPLSTAHLVTPPQWEGLLMHSDVQGFANP